MPKTDSLELAALWTQYKITTEFARATQWAINGGTDTHGALFLAFRAGIQSQLTDREQRPAALSEARLPTPRPEVKDSYSLDETLNYGRDCADRQLETDRATLTSGADRERAITGEPKKIIHGMWRDRFDRERYDYRDPKVSDRRAAPITGETSRDVAAEGDKP